FSGQHSLVNASRRHDLGQRPRALRRLPLLLASGALSACGGRAKGPTREAVAALHIGQREPEITAALGPPLRRAQPEPESVVLTYAEPGDLEVGHTSLSPHYLGSSLRFQITLHAGQLADATIRDLESSRRDCSCRAGFCRPDWADACLDLFPAAASPASRRVVSAPASRVPETRPPEIRPPATAACGGRVTRERVAALHPGMSEAELADALGPWSSRAPGPDRTSLTLSYLGLPDP